MSVLITDLCVACGACIGECPVGAIVDEFDNPMRTDIYFVKEDVCIECLGYAKMPSCALTCPVKGCIVWSGIEYSTKFRKNIKKEDRNSNLPVSS